MKEDQEEVPFQRCTLHKQIRNRQWPLVLQLLQQEQQQHSMVRQRNRMGWSSLILAIYHQAPDYIIHAMLPRHQDHKDVLSMRVPNGARLCVHFCARYTNDLSTVQLVVEGYPAALLVPSADGVRAVDRAVYYHKEAAIVEYLEQATLSEQKRVDLLKYNQQLRRVAWMCCERKYSSMEDEEEDNIVMQVYRYTKERELVGLFVNVLSFVGSTSIPAKTQKETISHQA